MSEKTFLALFSHVNPAAEAIAQLREMGMKDEQMQVISGIPFTAPILGRPHPRTNVPRMAMGGALVGLLLAMFFAIGTPNLYPVYVGGQPLIPVPPSVIATFELTMLGMLLATFLGVFLDSRFPS